MVSDKSNLKIIPIAKPYFDSEEERLVLKTVRSGWIAQGRMVEEFEERLRRYVGARYAVSVSSGTTALHLALLISGIGPGDEVIVPSFSFIATANAVLYCGARPVFIDIDLKTYNIDPEMIGAFIKRRCRFDAGKKAVIDKETGARVKAIMPVHQFGLPCDIDAISKIAREYGLAVIEDAACAIGSSYKGKRIGGGRNIVCFSFHPRKVLTTGEGGAIVTDNKSCAEKAMALRNHGMRKAPIEDYVMLGYNYRLTDLQAAIGIAQISKVHEILKKRVYLAERYNRAFKTIDSLKIPHIPSYGVTNYQSYVIRIGEDSFYSRDNLIKELSKKGICARRGNTAIHLQAIYKKITKGLRLPNTEKAASQTMALPIFFGMTKDEQDRVIDTMSGLTTNR